MKTTLKPSWEPYMTPRQKKAEAWTHRCDRSGQRIVTSEMMVDLGGCPFCGGYPPDVSFREMPLIGGSTIRWSYIGSKPYPPPPTLQRDNHLRKQGGAAAMAAHLADVQAQARLC